jgi:DNA-binding transcriptional MerR regulator
MEMRVEQLSAQADVSVDTIRYYQSKGLLAPPRREGRIAWYGDEHLGRLTRIRTLQQRGFTLATIARLVSGDLDAADEALLGQLSGLAPSTVDAPSHETSSLTGVGGGTDEATYTLDELASTTGMPLALLKALEAEGLLIPTRVAGQARFTEEDVAASQAGLRLLEWGIPLTDLLDLARRHNEATESTARQAVEMFARHIREPLRAGIRPDALSHSDHATGPLAGRTGDPAVDGLLQAYGELLPAVNTLVGHHFTRTLVRVALDHVEREGSDEERQAVRDRIRTDGGDARPVDASSRSGR